MINFNEFTASLSKKARSCGPCAIVKRSCDHGRPCGRCVSLGIQDKCIIFADKRKTKTKDVEANDDDLKVIVSSSLLSSLSQANNGDNGTKTASSSSSIGTEVSSVGSSKSLSSSSSSSFVIPHTKRQRNGTTDNNTLPSIPPTIGPSGFNMEYDSLIVAPSFQYPHLPSLSPAYILNRAENLASSVLNVFNMIPSVPYHHLLEYNKYNPLASSSIIDHSRKRNQKDTFLTAHIFSSSSSSSSLIRSIPTDNHGVLHQPQAFLPFQLPSTDPETASLLEQKHLESIASLSVPCLRIVYKDPDWSMLQSGASLPIKYISANAKYANFVGLPSISPGRLLFIKGDQKLPSQAHLHQRLDYGRIIMRAVVARLPVVRQRYSMCAATGFITVDELTEIFYGPTGAVHSVNMSIYNPDYTTLEPFTQIDLDEMDTSNVPMIEDYPESVTKGSENRTSTVSAQSSESTSSRTSVVTSTLSDTYQNEYSCEYDCYAPWIEYDPSSHALAQRTDNDTGTKRDHNFVQIPESKGKNNEDPHLSKNLSLPFLPSDYRSPSTLSLTPNHNTDSGSDSERFPFTSLSSSPLSPSITELSLLKGSDGSTLDDTGSVSSKGKDGELFLRSTTENIPVFFDPFDNNDNDGIG